MVPDTMYSVPYFIALLVILPWGSWVAHIIAAAFGYLCNACNNQDFLGLLDAILISHDTIHKIEAAGMFSWFAKQTCFVPAAGAVQLPMPGSYPDEMMYETILPRNPSTSSEHSGNFMNKVQGIFSSSEHVAVPTNDPGQHLLWEDEPSTSV